MLLQLLPFRLSSSLVYEIFHSSRNCKFILWCRDLVTVKKWNASQVCVSTLRRGHNANFLCIAPMLVCVVMYSRSNACCLHLWYLTSEIWYLCDLPICWFVSVSSFFFPMPKASKTRWEFSLVNKISIWKQYQHVKRCTVLSRHLKRGFTCHQMQRVAVLIFFSMLFFVLSWHLKRGLFAVLSRHLKRGGNWVLTCHQMQRAERNRTRRFVR